jgi:hypothetical protein
MKKKESSYIDFISGLILPFGFILYGIHIFLISPKSLDECSYSQGVLEKKNGYYKTLSLKYEGKPLDFDIPCADYTELLYFKYFNDELFEKMNSILSSDSTEHYIQIWYQWFTDGGKSVGSSITYDYYQIIIDGKIIKSFNKWDNKKVAIGDLIIGVTLLILLIMLYIKDRKKMKQELAE